MHRFFDKKTLHKRKPFLHPAVVQRRKVDVYGEPGYISIQQRFFYIVIDRADQDRLCHIPIALILNQLQQLVSCPGRQSPSQCFRKQAREKFILVA